MRSYPRVQLRSELNTRGVAGKANLTCRLREAAVMLGNRDNCQGVGEIDFRRALRNADLPLTESDTRRIFAHFEVRVFGGSGWPWSGSLVACDVPVTILAALVEMCTLTRSTCPARVESNLMHMACANGSGRVGPRP